MRFFLPYYFPLPWEPRAFPAHPSTVFLRRRIIYKDEAQRKMLNVKQEKTKISFKEYVWIQFYKVNGFLNGEGKEPNQRLIYIPGDPSEKSSWFSVIKTSLGHLAAWEVTYLNLFNRKVNTAWNPKETIIFLAVRLLCIVFTRRKTAELAPLNGVQYFLGFIPFPSLNT